MDNYIIELTLASRSDHVKFISKRRLARAAHSDRSTT